MTPLDVLDRAFPFDPEHASFPLPCRSPECYWTPGDIPVPTPWAHYRPCKNPIGHHPSRHTDTGPQYLPGGFTAGPAGAGVPEADATGRVFW